MSAVSFLKKIGIDALKAVQVGTEVIPFLQPFSMFIPKYGDKVVTVEGQVLGKLGDFQVVVNRVQQIERDIAIVTSGGSGTGAAKANAVAQDLPTLLESVELLGGTTIGKKFNSLSDDKKKLFNAQCGKIAGDFADLLNILE